MVYTSMKESMIGKLHDAFVKKHPDIAFDYYSAGAGKLMAKVAAERQPERRRIGVVFQDYAAWPHKTVYDNVIYPLQIQKVPRAEAHERAMSAVSQVNPGTLEKRLPFQLSGGQQQRVALAGALVSAPEIMLLDEPLSNLDPKLREEMRFEIKDLQRRFGFTILYVTHDQSEAMALSDRILVMNNGVAQQVDTPLNIYTKPVNEFVFSFIGLSNFLPAVVSDGSAFIEGAIEAGPVTRALPERLSADRLTLATRPSEIDFVRDGGVKATVKRITYLGDTIDYRVMVGETEVRIQKNRMVEILKEGQSCRLAFNRILWYDGRDGK